MIGTLSLTELIVEFCASLGRIVRAETAIGSHASKNPVTTITAFLCAQLYTVFDVVLARGISRIVTVEYGHEIEYFQWVAARLADQRGSVLR